MIPRRARESVEASRWDGQGHPRRLPGQFFFCARSTPVSSRARSSTSTAEPYWSGSCCHCRELCGHELCGNEPCGAGSELVLSEVEGTRPGCGSSAAVS